MVEENPTAWNVQRVAFAIVAVHMAARGCESVYLDWENVNLTTPFDNDAGEGCIMIKGWYRGKNVQGAKKESSCLITGSREVKILTMYMNLHKPELRKGRFWKKLLKCDINTFKKVVLNDPNANPVIKVMNSPVGKNTIDNYPRDLAKELGKENWIDFSGHTWRRTAVSIGADMGMTLVELKRISGHKSDSVVQGYIEDSSLSKRTVSEALSVASTADDFRKRAMQNPAIPHFQPPPHSPQQFPHLPPPHYYHTPGFVPGMPQYMTPPQLPLQYNQYGMYGNCPSYMPFPPNYNPH
jgi:hypothetical protein